jgi:hypothetical protein
MLVAYRLAGLSAHETHYVGADARTQSGMSTGVRDAALVPSRTRPRPSGYGLNEQRPARL